LRKYNKKFNNNIYKNFPYNYHKNLYSKIPKSNLIFNKNYEMDIEKEEEENMIKLEKEKEKEDFDQNLDINKIITMNEDKDKDKNQSMKKEEENIEYNNEYNTDLNFNKLLDIMNETKDDNYREYILNKINNAYLDKDIFTNKCLIYCFEEYKNDELKNLIVGKYRRNFLYIKKEIEYLLQSVIDKISTIPYTIRCICKIIYLLMSKKFKDLPKYYINAFVGKFFFGKYIFPVLSLEYKNILNNRIFSNKNIKFINTLINIIEKAYKGELFQTQVDTEKTIFNFLLYSFN
jgi:hypothetical protein